MRRPSKLELGMLVGGLIATGVAHATENIPTVTVTGYYYDPFAWDPSFANSYASNPQGGSGPAGVYSANPTAHCNCVTGQLSQAQKQGSNSTPSQPNNTSLNPAVRNANPIDITNGSSIGAQYGGVNGSGGFMVFPNLAAGTNAAIASANNYSSAGYTISGLVNAWAPPASNPNAMANTLSGLGITQSLADSTHLNALTSSQLMQVVAAFAWQEGFKPSGC